MEVDDQVDGLLNVGAFENGSNGLRIHERDSKHAGGDGGNSATSSRALAD